MEPNITLEYYGRSEANTRLFIDKARTTVYAIDMNGTLHPFMTWCSGLDEFIKLADEAIAWL